MIGEFRRTLKEIRLHVREEFPWHVRPICYLAAVYKNLIKIWKQILIHAEFFINSMKQTNFNVDFEPITKIRENTKKLEGIYDNLK